VHLAATPAWFADNVAAIAILTLLALTVLVLRLVHQVAWRAALLGLLAAVALFVYVNRAPLETCARTCECQMAGQDITVPVCSSDVEL
jgi:membrane associated rhomboid family serine protease